MGTKIWWESLKERDHSEDLGREGRITLKCILRKYGGRVWNGFVRLRIGTGCGFLQHVNDPSGSIKDGEFLTT
jgi:hypothetical protein